MSRGNRMRPLKLIDAATMDADIKSAGVFMGQNTRASIRLRTTGGTTHSGPFYVQETDQPDVDASWDTVGSYAIAAGAAVAHTVDVVDVGGKYIRGFWDRTAGVVTEFLSATITKKP